MNPRLLGEKREHHLCAMQPTLTADTNLTPSMKVLFLIIKISLVGPEKKSTNAAKKMFLNDSIKSLQGNLLRNREKLISIGNKKMIDVKPK